MNFVQVTYESAYSLGEKQPAYMKYGIGGFLVLLLILIIWFPLLFMSVVTTNSIPNPPTGFSCSLSVGGFEVESRYFLSLEFKTFFTYFDVLR